MTPDIGASTAAAVSSARDDRPLAYYPDSSPEAVAEGVELLENAGWRVLAEPLGSAEEMAARVAELQPRVLMVAYLPVTDAVLSAAPSLRVVSCAAVGVDNVDLESAARHGIVVCNVLDAATEEVATHAVAMALMLVRRIAQLDRHVRSGGWSFEAGGVPRRTSTLTLGIVGLGRIGQAVARLAGPFFAGVVGFDPFVAAPPPGVRPASFEECLALSDVVTLHLPLSARTARLVDGNALALMRAGSYLVNVARGGLVDAIALRAALDSGRLAGAALDVTDPEPPALDDPLRSHPHVVLTPHAAFYSAEGLRAYVVGQAENVIAWAATGTPLSSVEAGSSA